MSGWDRRHHREMSGLHWADGYTCLAVRPRFWPVPAGGNSHINTNLGSTLSFFVRLDEIASANVLFVSWPASWSLEWCFRVQGSDRWGFSEDCSSPVPVSYSALPLVSGTCATLEHKGPSVFGSEGSSGTVGLRGKMGRIWGFGLASSNKPNNPDQQKRLSVCRPLRTWIESTVRGRSHDRWANRWKTM